MAVGSKIRVLAAAAVAFGALTIRAGGAVLVSEKAATAAGDYVPFVLWFNFLAGFAYVAAGVGLWLRRPWGARLALAIAIATLAVFAAFAVHVLSGGAYETRTAYALALRTIFWFGAWALARRWLAGP